MKLKDYLTRTLLVALIVLSVVLSYFIWMSPVKETAADDEPTATKVTRTGKSATELFLPAKGIWFTKEQNLSTTKESFLNVVQAELIKASYGTLTAASDEDNYSVVLKGKNGVELDYVGNFLLGEFIDVYGIKLNLGNEKMSASLFDRIVLDFDKEMIYFLNNAKHTVYQASIDLDQGEILEALEKDKANLIPLTLNHATLPELYYVDQAFSLPKYNYILATQPYSTFTQALFQSTEELSISNVGEELTYSNNLGDNLSIENETGKVYYSRTENAQADTASLANIYKQSYQNVSQLGSTLGNLRFFDASGESLLFTTFVEGYPVFSPDFQGQARLEYSEKVLTRIYSNVESVQIPIPSDEEETLPATEDFLASLASAGVDLKKIENVQIGYQWQSLTETSQVVELVPQWFVRYDEQWYTKPELLAQLKEAK